MAKTDFFPIHLVGHSGDLFQIIWSIDQIPQSPRKTLIYNRKYLPPGPGTPFSTVPYSGLKKKLPKSVSLPKRDRCKNILVSIVIRRSNWKISMPCISTMYLQNTTESKLNSVSNKPYNAIYKVGQIIWYTLSLTYEKDQVINHGWFTSPVGD